MPYSAAESNKANWCLWCALIALFLIIGTSFFVSSTFFNGILIIAIPVILMLMAVGCILSNRPREETWPDDEEIGLQRRNNTGTEVEDRNPFSDCPPSYRLTWRRSFLKRLKSTSMFSDRSAENTPPITPNPKAQEIDSPTEIATASVVIETTANPSLTESSSNDHNQLRQGSDGLPSYDEAVEIMASMENIS